MIIKYIPNKPPLTVQICLGKIHVMYIMYKIHVMYLYKVVHTLVVSSINLLGGVACWATTAGGKQMGESTASRAPASMLSAMAQV